MTISKRLLQFTCLVTMFSALVGISCSPGAAESGLPLTKPSANLPPLKINPNDGAEMILIPDGAFPMGSAVTDRSAQRNEAPQHTVFLDAYYIYKNDVTVAQYRKFCAATARQMPRPPVRGWKDDHPISCVNWDDANAYAHWAGACLPSEAQWEKAARGTDSRAYPWGDIWDSTKCHGSKIIGDAGGTAPVGSFPLGASPYGVLDMTGNCSQWCADWYSDDYYAISPTRNPSGPDIGTQRVLRGAAWLDSRPFSFRVATRSRDNPAFSYGRNGFRCVVMPGQASLNEKPVMPGSNVEVVDTKAHLTVTTVPAGSTIFLDGKQLDKLSNCTLTITLGIAKSKVVELGLTLDGYEDEVRKVTLERGMSGTVVVNFRKNAESTTIPTSPAETKVPEKPATAAPVTPPTPVTSPTPAPTAAPVTQPTAVPPPTPTPTVAPVTQTAPVTPPTPAPTVAPVTQPTPITPHAPASTAAPVAQPSAATPLNIAVDNTIYPMDLSTNEINAKLTQVKNSLFFLDSICSDGKVKVYYDDFLLPNGAYARMKFKWTALFCTTADNILRQPTPKELDFDKENPRFYHIFAQNDERIRTTYAQGSVQLQIPSKFSRVTFKPNEIQTTQQDHLLQVTLVKCLNHSLWLEMPGTLDPEEIFVITYDAAGRMTLVNDENNRNYFIEDGTIKFRLRTEGVIQKLMVFMPTEYVTNTFEIRPINTPKLDKVEKGGVISTRYVPAGVPLKDAEFEAAKLKESLTVISRRCDQGNEYNEHSIVLKLPQVLNSMYAEIDPGEPQLIDAKNKTVEHSTSPNFDIDTSTYTLLFTELPAPFSFANGTLHLRYPAKLKMVTLTSAKPDDGNCHALFHGNRVSVSADIAGGGDNGFTIPPYLSGIRGFDASGWQVQLINPVGTTTVDGTEYTTYEFWGKPTIIRLVTVEKWLTLDLPYHLPPAERLREAENEE